MTDTLVHPQPEDLSPDDTVRFADLSESIGGVLQSMSEVSDYLERLVHAVRRHVDGCDEVGVTIVTDGRPHTAAYTTVQTLEIDAVQYALDEGPCLDAARHRRENVVDDLCAEDTRWPAFTAQAEEEGMRSLFALPLVSGGECLGALNLYGWQVGAFTDFDPTLVRVAAQRCADAVLAVTSLDDMRQLAGQLEQAMASRAVIEQAKGVIMAMRGIPEDEAFEVLRRSSQDRNVKVRVLAQEVVRGVVEQRARPNASGGR